MALPGSGTISLNDIYYEFPGTLDDPTSAAPVGIDEYYRGGTYVPYIAENYGIPTSGTIAFNNFYNGVGYFNFEQYWSGGNVFYYNLRNQLVSGGWDTVKPVYAKITCSSTSNFGSIVPSTPGCYIGDLPLGSTVILTIESGGYIEGGAAGTGVGVNGGTGLLIEFSNTKLYNYGTIYGGSGKGGNGNGERDGVDTPGSNGGNGGNAILINLPSLKTAFPTIYNYGGIAGGGGGGGGGGKYCIATSCGGTPTFCAPGGGGGGGRGGPRTNVFFANGGDGGPIASGYCPPDGGYTFPGAGSGGSSSSGGLGGVGGTNSGASGGAGGNGGDFGSNGNGGGIGYGGGAGGNAKYTPSGSSTTVVQGSTYGAWA